MSADKEIREILPRVPIKKFPYVRRPRPEHRALRDAFQEGVRRDFVLHMVENSGEALRKAGLSKAQIDRIAETGRLPSHLNVHHIRPLDDGGTNAFSNLVIMRKYPDHEALHQYADPQLRGLGLGQRRVIDLPMPPAGIYVADNAAKQEIPRGNVPALQAAAQVRRARGGRR